MLLCFNSPDLLFIYLCYCCFIASTVSQLAIFRIAYSLITSSVLVQLLLVYLCILCFVFNHCYPLLDIHCISTTTISEFFSPLLRYLPSLLFFFLVRWRLCAASNKWNRIVIIIENKRRAGKGEQMPFVVRRPPFPLPSPSFLR